MHLAPFQAWDTVMKKIYGPSLQRWLGRKVRKETGGGGGCATLGFLANGTGWLGLGVGELLTSVIWISSPVGPSVSLPSCGPSMHRATESPC